MTTWQGLKENARINVLVQSTLDITVWRDGGDLVVEVGGDVDFGIARLIWGFVGDR
jgi:hypothetical protein